MRAGIEMVIAAALCVIALFLTVAHGGPFVGLPADSSRHVEASLGIRGHVRGLYPGASKKLRLRLANRHRFAVRLDSIEIKGGAGATACPPENLEIGSPQPHEKRLPPTSRRTVRASVKLRPSAPDSCSGAKLPLHYRAHAHRTGSGS